MKILRKLISRFDNPINSYSDFWQWFIKNEFLFFNVIKSQGNVEKKFFNKLSPKLDQIKEGIFYLTGMYDENTVELILTPDGNLKNVVFIEELIEAAPKIDRWKFTALKPPHEIKNVSIEMGLYEFNAENLFFYPIDHEDYPDEIDIVVIHSDFSNENSTIITNGTYIFLDNYLGELNFISTIDQITIKGLDTAEKELVSISKLKEFINWRQKEFIEKYQGLRRNTDEDSYSLLTMEGENGKKRIAVINSELLKWDKTASHPWIMVIEIKFKGENNGMPNEETSALLNKIEDELLEELKDLEGYLNIGRQTSKNLREIFFACKNFRKPSKIAYEFEQIYADQLSLNFEIYKDKYWKSFNHFKVY